VLKLGITLAPSPRASAPQSLNLGSLGKRSDNLHGSDEKKFVFGERGFTLRSFSEGGFAELFQTCCFIVTGFFCRRSLAVSGLF
jgi:hypothetical protein